MTMYNSSVDQRVDAALANNFLRQATRRATDRLRHNKYKATDELGSWEEWRNAGAEIRSHVIENLDYYLQQLIQQTEKRGVQVHLAKTPEDAVAVVRDIVKKHDAKNVIKSKSMISEEIHLNHFLQADGVLSVETDLGEYILQVAGEPPSHIIVPAMHKTRQQVADLFEPIAGQTLSSDTPRSPALSAFKCVNSFCAGILGSRVVTSLLPILGALLW